MCCRGLRQRLARAAPSERRARTAGKLLMFAGCLMALLYLGSRSVLDYLSEPVRSSTQVVAAAAPNLTVCPGWALPAAGANVSRLWAAGAVSQAALVRAADPPLTGVVARCRAGGRTCCRPVCGNDTVLLGRWRPVFVLGQHRPLLCHRLQLGPAAAAIVQRNGGLSLDFHVPAGAQRSGSLFDVLVHDGARPVLRYGAGSRSVSAAAAWERGRPHHVALRVSATHTVSVSLRRQPCRDRPGYNQQRCRMACEHAVAAAAAGCRSLGADGPPPPQPLCANASALEALYERLFRPPEGAALECACPPACSVTEYRGTEERRFYPGAPLPTVNVVVEPTAALVRQQRAGSLQQLVSELGGLLGLLLGASAWTLLELLWRAAGAVCGPAAAPGAPRPPARDRWTGAAEEGRGPHGKRTVRPPPPPPYHQQLHVSSLEEAGC
ncbi:Acid-sensing ion channel 3 [Amphibalanus amphitrite]|uniref:Acid-sensing ion channel 3 n=1 Tax=Amphibalanus amphitrite TaxID=1232801 RepID=A0A6A4VUJ9_AMPAM|nr:Acid-sensing ion channel 3 [Amphibalanus amphitrite]